MGPFRITLLSQSAYVWSLNYLGDVFPLFLPLSLSSKGVPLVVFEV